MKTDKNTKGKSLIIFDFDGVLRSASWEGIFEGYLAVIKNLGKDYRNFFRDIEEFKKWWNPDWKKNNERLEIADQETANEIFYECYEPYTALFPWVPNALKHLSQKYALAISSNASEKSIKNSLGKWASYFSCIAGSEHVKELKPEPESINFILKKLNALPSRALMIGDMMMDISAGKSAAIKTGAVSWGLGEWEDLLKLNPDHHFQNPDDLLSI